jgi:hypothetical protein
MVVTRSPLCQVLFPHQGKNWSWTRLLGLSIGLLLIVGLHNGPGPCSSPYYRLQSRSKQTPIYNIIYIYIYFLFYFKRQT